MARRAQAYDLTVGVTTDAVFGPVVLFGQGGVAVEATADQALALPPLNHVLAADLVGRTRVPRLLAGFRDRPRADLDALYDVLVQVGQLAAHLPELAELDINPLLADAHGVDAFDALMRLAAVAPGTDPLARLAFLPYPDALECRVDSALGPLTLRPIRPEDAPAHQAFFRALAPRTSFSGCSRRCASCRRPSCRASRRSTTRKMAFIATRVTAASAETLGVARVNVDPDNTVGELAIVVRSDVKGSRAQS